MRRIDCHVHLVGDGSSGSDCFIHLDTLFRRIQSRVMLLEAGVAPKLLGRGLDVAYAETIRKQIVESSLDAAVLLAQDLPHDDFGKPLPKKAGFYASNEYLFQVVAESPDVFIPAISIHPGRPDAMDELEKCIELGARVLKLLPNCLNVDCSAEKYRPFWERVAEAGIVFLSHTGGEHTLPVLRAEFADPRNLTLPLECGVTVIAAHCAGRSGVRDPDYTDGLITMFDEYPRLFGDNSAFSSLNRARTAKRILRANVMDRIIHGSDFPVPILGIGPFGVGLISRADYAAGRKIRNPFERDCLLKKAMGFDAATFTRMDEILDMAQNESTGCVRRKDSI